MVDYRFDMSADEGLCADAPRASPRSDRISAEPRIEMGDHQRRQGAGTEREIGSLEAGKRAAIALFDPTSPMWACCTGDLDLHLRRQRQPTRAPAGRRNIVYRRELARLADVAGVIAEAERIGRTVLDQAGLNGRLGGGWM